MPLSPGPNCPLCPRLAEFRGAQRALHPDWHNAPVPSFGPPSPPLLIVGLAPGLKGANRTGRPFTGDYAGDLLYQTLLDAGFADGTYGRVAEDGLRLIGCRIVNAVRCVPPANKPTPLEVRTCRSFLSAELAGMPERGVVVALGRIAHDSVLAALGQVPARWIFGHRAVHALPDGRTLIDSYHCSRQNTNTGRLTAEMFRGVFSTARDALERLHPRLDPASPPAGPRAVVSPSE